MTSERDVNPATSAARVIVTSESPDRLAAGIARILSHATPAGWRPSGVTRTLYLDLIEIILNTAATWQNEHGAIIDPVAGREAGQTSCRFVSPGAVLLAAGRAAHLREHVLRGMDWCCMRLATRAAESPDFWMRELMTAWNALLSVDVDPVRREAWAANIRRVVPELTYQFVSPDGSKLAQLHNWTVYASAGEALRELAGLGPEGDDGSVIWGHRFFEKYMPAQLTHFTELGMYRDPNDPMTYDMTTRLQIATPFAAGFTSPLRDEYDDLLRRGALTQLLYASPSGFAPFGGRSNQMNLQEVILAALCELEARRYKQSDPRLAAAFKRQAHVHAQAIMPWLHMNPIRHLKNGFDPSARHGCEAYAHWSVYSLFTASCMALAYQFADDSILESPAPAEIGGFVLELTPAFHKVFATVGQSQIEIDTMADPHYDAIGLGRFLHANLPPALALSTPIPAHPSFHIPDDLLPEQSIAIGPSWQSSDGTWVHLSAIDEDLEASLETHHISPDIADLTVTWRHRSSATVITQRYQLTAGQLSIDAQVIAPTPVGQIRFTVPLLESDGQTQTQIQEEPEQVTVLHPKGTYRILYGNAQATLGKPVANRNAIYRPLVLTAASISSIRLTLQLTETID